MDRHDGGPLWPVGIALTLLLMLGNKTNHWVLTQADLLGFLAMAVVVPFAYGLNRKQRDLSRRRLINLCLGLLMMGAGITTIANDMSRWQLLGGALILASGLGLVALRLLEAKAGVEYFALNFLMAGLLAAALPALAPAWQTPAMQASMLLCLFYGFGLGTLMSDPNCWQGGRRREQAELVLAGLALSLPLWVVGLCLELPLLTTYGSLLFAAAAVAAVPTLYFSDHFRSCDEVTRVVLVLWSGAVMLTSLLLLRIVAIGGDPTLGLLNYASLLVAPALLGFACLYFENPPTILENSPTISAPEYRS